MNIKATIFVGQNKTGTTVAPLLPLNSCFRSNVTGNCISAGDQCGLTLYPTHGDRRKEEGKYDSN